MVLYQNKIQWAKHQRTRLCVSVGICCSSAGGYQTALRCCGAPFWIEGELPVFVVRPHAPNRDACTVTARYEYIDRATPKKQMYHLRHANGIITSDPVEIRKMAVDFYATLYSKESCDPKSTEELLHDLPKLAN